MEAVNNVCRKAPAPATVAAIFTVDEAEAPNGEVKHLSDLDPRSPEEEFRVHPAEDLVPYHLDPEHSERGVMLGSKLHPDTQAELEQFLREHRDVFAWSHEDMPEIDPAVICHQLSVNPRHKPVIQK